MNSKIVAEIVPASAKMYVKSGFYSHLSMD